MSIKYTVLENDYILAEYEDGRVFTIPNDESNADYQRYLNPEAFDEASFI
jgi:hypothetical protein